MRKGDWCQLALLITHHAHRAPDPVVHPERIVALEKPRITPPVPAEQSRPSATRTPRRVLDHGERFRDGEFPTAQAHHADARGNVVIEHDNGVFVEAFQHPVSHGADAGDLIGDGFDFQPGVTVMFSLACGNEQCRRREQLVAGDRAAPAAGQDHQSKGERTEFRPDWRGGRGR